MRRPHPSLAPFVRSLEGFDESTASSLRRLEPAAAEAVLIFGFGAPVVVGADTTSTGSVLSSFFVPLRNQPLRVESSGSQAGVQVNLTPVGARTIVGAPLRAVMAATDVSELFSRQISCLADHLADTHSWAARLDLVERILWATLEANGDTPAPLAESWRLLVSGSVRITEVADAVGWSRQHLHRQYHREFGHGPQTLARLVRFQRASRLLGQRSLCDVAAACGYYDQAHLNREFMEFAGSSPQRLLAAHMPDSGGIKDVTSVQDRERPRPPE